MLDLSETTRARDLPHLPLPRTLISAHHDITSLRVLCATLEKERNDLAARLKEALDLVDAATDQANAANARAAALEAYVPR